MGTSGGGGPRTQLLALLELSLGVEALSAYVQVQYYPCKSDVRVSVAIHNSYKTFLKAESITRFFVIQDPSVHHFEG